MNDISHLKCPTVKTVVRPITPADLSTIVEMLSEFAAFEEHGEPVRSTVDSLYSAMFDPRPLLLGFIAHRDDEPAGFILGSIGYSTYTAKPRLFIEDLYVRADCRAGGVGRTLISAFARLCADHDYAGLRWRVVASNTPAVRFYSSIGAIFSDDRRDCSLTGDSLKALASGEETRDVWTRFALGNGPLLGR